MKKASDRRWLVGLVATAQVPGPSVLIEHDARYSPWVDVARLQAQGALWMWEAQGESTPTPPPPAPLDQLPQDGPGWHAGTWTLAWPHDGTPWRVHWRAYVPAACAR